MSQIDFLKFRPLVELIIAEGGIPTDYKLNRAFIVALRRLRPYVTEGGRQRVVFGAVAFEGEEEL